LRCSPHLLDLRPLEHPFRAHHQGSFRPLSRNLRTKDVLVAYALALAPGCYSDRPQVLQAGASA
jgi:hypothetical protein